MSAGAIARRQILWAVAGVAVVGLIAYWIISSRIEEIKAEEARKAALAVREVPAKSRVEWTEYLNRRFDELVEVHRGMITIREKYMGTKFWVL